MAGGVYLGVVVVWWMVDGGCELRVMLAWLMRWVILGRGGVNDGGG